MHEVKGEKNVKETVVQLSLDYNADLLFMQLHTVLFLKPYISTAWFLCPSFPVLEPG